MVEDSSSISLSFFGLVLQAEQAHSSSLPFVRRTHLWDSGSVRVFLHCLPAIVILFWNTVPEASIWEAQNT